MDPDEIVSAYPTITLSDVHAALAYYYENANRLTILSERMSSSRQR